MIGITIVLKTNTTFEMQFAEIYPDFLKGLLTRNRKFSMQELRVCMCIKLCYSNSQIQSHLKISERTLFNIRSGVRKKLALESKDNLNEIIICI